MTFCDPSGYLNSFRLAARDILGVNSAYGAGPSRFVFQDPWRRQVATIDAEGVFSSDSFVEIDGIPLDARALVVGRNGSVLLHDGVGRLDVGTVSAAGEVSLVDSATGIGSWPIMTAVQNGYFLGYDPGRNGGAAAVFRVDAHGRYRGRVQLAADFGTNWTHVVGMPNGEILFFEKSEGHGMVARLNALGALSVQVHALPCCFGKFDLLAAAGMNTVLLYKRAPSGEGVGLGQTSTIDEDGGYKFVGFATGMPAFLEGLAGARNGVVLLFNDVAGADQNLNARLGKIDGAGAYSLVRILEHFGHFGLISAQ